MDGVVFNGTMRDICTELKIDLEMFGNMPISEYQAVRRNIAKYGIAAVRYYKRQRLEQLNENVAKQFGLSAEEFQKQLEG